MSELLAKCAVCGGLLDEEDIFCSNCGTEAPLHRPEDDVQVDIDFGEQAQRELELDGEQSAGPPPVSAAADGDVAASLRPPPLPAARVTTHNFTCAGCGASMSYDASAKALRCPFCGSEQLNERPDAKEIAPEGVVPFLISKSEAESAMRRWLGQGFWRPGDLAIQAAVVKMTPVYVPYWVFRAETHTYWAADTSKVPLGTRGDWQPMTGEHYGRYDGLIVGASGALTASETAALCPFDLTAAVPPEEVDLENAICERFTVPRKYARSLARAGLESNEGEACQQYVPGKCRNMKVAVRISNMSSRPLLAPVWIMAYRYREQAYRFLVNGQTGRCVGQAPISYRKLAAAIAIAVVILIVLLLIFAGR